MKKKLVSALALMMSCVMLAACGGNKVEENTATPQTETSEAVTESTEEAASTETEAAGELTDVNVAALKGPTAMGMVKLMDDSDNGDTGANHYNFTIAASPDEITPQIVQGNVDIAAVPANLASVLYNKEGVDVSVLAVNTLGVLYIVENGDSVQSVADLKGKTIYASGKGATARSIRLDLPQFTLIGATTRAGLLSAPLRDRFGVVSHMEFYTVPELEKIIIRSANVLNVDIDSDGAHELARRSRGTPRLANRLLKRVRDFAQVKYNGHINKDVADYALNLLDVDRDGLDRNDRVILTTIVDKFDGGPVGIETLAASIGEDSGTLEDVYEPYLIQNGYINRTPRGRVATKAAYDNLGRPFKQK